MSEEAAPASPLDKKVVRSSPVLWGLGLVFALLLGSLGTRALMDIADLFREPDLDGLRAPLVQPIERERRAIQEAPDARRDAIARAERDQADLDRTLASAEETWRTWLETRGALGPGGDDREIRARRDRLDALRKERDEAARRLVALRAEPDPRAAALADVDRRIAAASRTAEEQHDAAHRVWTLKVLGARLALVVPLLALGAWLWLRRARSTYLTLLWGYWAFCLWMLLYGIGPYLPHYGGYAPLALGAGVTIWASVALVRMFNRRAPLRRRRIVDRAIARHRCPGCERDYLVGRETALDAGLARKATQRHYDAAALRPRACSSCGLALFGGCAACGHEQIVHLERCAACGAPWQTPAAPAAPA